MTALETDDVAVRSRWAEALDRTLCEMDVAFRPEGLPFRAEITTTPLSELSLCVVQAGPHTVVRSPAMIASDSLDDYLLCLATSGTLSLDQNGRCSTLSPGTFGIVDSAAPFVVSAEGPFAQIVLRIPRSALEARTAPLLIGSAVGLQVPRSGVGRLTANMVMDTAAHCTSLENSSSQTVTDALLDLVGASMSEIAVLPTARERTHTEHLRDVQRVMLTHLDKPERTLTDIALECGMSVRYVHTLFRSCGSTPRAWWMHQRLERARLLLLRTSLSLAEVGAQSGFSDPSHLSRAVRQKFGATPTELRGRRGTGEGGP